MGALLLYPMCFEKCDAFFLPQDKKGEEDGGQPIIERRSHGEGNTDRGLPVGRLPLRGCAWDGAGLESG
ncbi:MAG: hypothetical protein IIZ39_04740, partial [Blautia sp.]|nr:hypothetical protein [Blautia sp.]